MNKEIYRKKIIEQIIKEDQLKIITKINENEIEYSDKLGIEKPITSPGDEELVRALLVVRLVNEYEYDPSKILFEYQYDTRQGRGKIKRVDIVLLDNNNEIFYLIEVKSPFAKENFNTVIEGQLFNLAIPINTIKPIKNLMLFRINHLIPGMPNDCLIIDFKKYKDYPTWYKDGENVEYLIKKNYLFSSANNLKNIGMLITDVSSDMFEGIYNEFHNVLWGGGSSNDNDIFVALVNIFLAKIQDEKETNIGEEYSFQIKHNVDSDGVFHKESQEQTYERINDLYMRAIGKWFTDDVIDDKTTLIDKQKFSLSKLSFVVNKLQVYEISNINDKVETDVLGNFFEKLMKNNFKQTKGQYFTHKNIIRFILSSLGADDVFRENIKNEQQTKIIDPSCGAGGFLIESISYIRNALVKDNSFIKNETTRNYYDSLFPKSNLNFWAKDSLYGIEINSNLGIATKVNMILHGDGQANIFIGEKQGDGLKSFDVYEKEGNTTLSTLITKGNYSKKLNEKFDIVMSNPPFSVKLTEETKRGLKNVFTLSSKSNTEELFIERYFQLLKPSGRMGIVLPESIFDGPESWKIRKFIFSHFNVKAVISLSDETFKPFTPIKTSILFAQKKTDAQIADFNRTYKDTTKKMQLFLRSIKKGNKFSCEDRVEHINEFLQTKISSIDEIENNHEIEAITKTSSKRNSEGLSEMILMEKTLEAVSAEMFIAHIDEIGFKRTTRSETKIKNLLLNEEDEDLKYLNNQLRKEIKWD